jgi:8-oxo-dGTP diphosphatase
MKRLLLWLWKNLPMTAGMRFAALWLMNRKFLLGVNGVVVNEDGRVLLLYHSYRRDYPWGLPSGWVKRGEQPEEALIRELDEEVGLAVRVLALLDARIEPGLSRLDLTLLCRPLTPGATAPQPQDIEIQAAGFYRPGEFPGPLIRVQEEMITRGLALLGGPSDPPPGR